MHQNSSAEELELVVSSLFGLIYDFTLQNSLQSVQLQGGK